MAEASGIRELLKEGIQSILEGYSVNDSNRSLPQVPNKTLDYQACGKISAHHSIVSEEALLIA